MPLTTGTRLGSYQIVDAIGSGGMGEVYRARDTRLNRDVAIKIVLPAVASDPERVARFSREAQLLASLNHPNIAQVYGIEDDAGVLALIMELVEGPTLADRIEQGPIPIPDALGIARQIAEALEAAHEQAIVHRDLKPANIKVRHDGVVKVLDFGLAKAIAPASASGTLVSQSPTLSMQATVAGVILGTAAYMSPEQAAGSAVDRRSDLWAFAVVLLEMLTGRPVFSGETVSHVLASVLKSEPDWSRLPAGTPASIRRLLRRCLEKDRKRRLDSAAAARLEIDEAMMAGADAAAGGETSTRTGVSRRMASAVAALMAIAAFAGWTLTRRPSVAPDPPVRFGIAPPAGQTLDFGSAVSPDGRRIVYVASGAQAQLMMRAVDQVESVPIRGTAGARGPFFSPDGRWIGFDAPNQLKKISIAGGPPVVLCRTTGGWRGASWSAGGVIVFATSDTGTGLLSVNAAGGEPEVLTRPDPSQGERDHVYPFVLPGSGAVLFTITAHAPIDEGQIAVLDLKTRQKKTLIRGASAAVFVDPGYLVYAAAGSLHAVHFDVRRLEVSGDPVAVVERVRINETDQVGANFSVSPAGTLVYAQGAAGDQPVARSLVWVDRNGREEPIDAPSRGYTYPRLSPDGQQLAVDIRDQESDIWIRDLRTGTQQRLTLDPANAWFPVWTPDGGRVVFASARAGPLNLYSQTADGGGVAERLTTSPHIQWPYCITPDGKALVYMDQAPKTGFDLRLLRLDGTHRDEPLIETAAQDVNADISPDGRWLAYQSNESGKDEIFVRPFPDVAAGRWQISTDGGSRPVWSRNGRELFFLDPVGTLTAVPIQTGPVFTRGNASKLGVKRYYAGNTGRAYDVSRDGQRFLMVKDSASTQDATRAGLVVVLHWTDELKALLH